MWEGILTKQPASLKMNSGQEVTENKQVTTTAWSTGKVSQGIGKIVTKSASLSEKD